MLVAGATTEGPLCDQRQRIGRRHAAFRDLIVYDGKGSSGANEALAVTSSSHAVEAFAALKVDNVLTLGSGASLTPAGTTEFIAFANGSGAAVGAANTGRIIYDSTNQTFDVSNNGNAYPVDPYRRCRARVAGNT